jgi:hypothetical protein
LETETKETLYNINGYPKWIANPTFNGKYSYGAVGISGRSYKGPNHQRKLAVQRSIEELAAQIETNVVSETISYDAVTNQSASYKSETISTYKINKNISGKIMDTWVDARNSQLYIWMVIE